MIITVNSKFITRQAHEHGWFNRKLMKFLLGVGLIKFF